MAGVPPQLDIAANRGARKYTAGELVRRAAWAPAALLFRIVPRPLFGIRSALLRLFGARIGHNVRIEPTVLLTFPWNISIGDWSSVGARAQLYALGPIDIGQRTTISQEAHLCAGTHDYRSRTMELKKPPIRVGNDVWICADAFVGPGTSVGNGAVVGARAVVVRDVEEWSVVAGNPARKVGVRAFHSAEA